MIVDDMYKAALAASRRVNASREVHQCFRETLLQLDEWPEVDRIDAAARAGEMEKVYRQLALEIRWLEESLQRTADLFWAMKRK